MGFPISVPFSHHLPMGIPSRHWCHSSASHAGHRCEGLRGRVFGRCGKPFVFPQDSLQMDDFPLDCVVLTFFQFSACHTHTYIYYICVCIYLFYYYLLIERFIYIAAPTCSKNVSIHLLISPKWLVGCPCHSFVPEDVHIAGPNPRPAAVSCRSSGKSIEKISLRTYFSGEFSWFILIYTQSTPY